MKILPCCNECSHPIGQHFTVFGKHICVGCWALGLENICRRPV